MQTITALFGVTIKTLKHYQTGLVSITNAQILTMKKFQLLNYNACTSSNHIYELEQ